MQDLLLGLGKHQVRAMINHRLISEISISKERAKRSYLSLLGRSKYGWCVHSNAIFDIIWSKNDHFIVSYGKCDEIP
jgi:hypothetical protein